MSQVRERRKIVIKYSGNKYWFESLRLSSFGDDGRWEFKGRQYNEKGLYNLLKGKAFDFVLEPEMRAEIRVCLRKYIRKRKEKQKARLVERV